MIRNILDYSNQSTEKSYKGIYLDTQVNRNRQFCNPQKNKGLDKNAQETYCNKIHSNRFKLRQYARTCEIKVTSKSRENTEFQIRVCKEFERNAAMQHKENSTRKCTSTVN